MSCLNLAPLFTHYKRSDHAASLFLISKVQYADCDGDGSLLLTELDAEPGVDLSGLYLGCASLFDQYLPDVNFSNADLTGAALLRSSLIDVVLGFV